nr:hypothetical protein B0A51_11278 [Rachicladosporium sp. CCFEE 5018]
MNTLEGISVEHLLHNFHTLLVDAANACQPNADRVTKLHVEWIHDEVKDSLAVCELIAQKAEKCRGETVVNTRRKGERSQEDVNVKTGRSRVNDMEQHDDSNESALRDGERTLESRIDREDVIRTAAMNPNLVVPTIERKRSITTGVPADLVEYFRALARSLNRHAESTAKHSGCKCELTTADALGDGLAQMADAMQGQADEMQNIIKHWPKSE